MSKILMIAQREYLENVRTKGFWIGILVFPLILGLAIGVPILVERGKAARAYAVIDESGWLLESIEREAAVADLAIVIRAAAERHAAGGSRRDQIPEPLRPLAAAAAGLQAPHVEALARRIVEGVEAGTAGAEIDDVAVAQRESVLAWWRAATPAEIRRLARNASRARFTRVATPAGADAEAELARRIHAKELFAYIVIGPDPVQGTGGSKYVSNNLTDDALRNWFAAHASATVRARRLDVEGITPQTAAWIQTPVDFEARRVGASGEETGVETRDMLRQWGPVGFVYMLWIGVFAVSQMLLTNMIEEKSNRIIEVLLSAVSPIQLMAGKILGIALTGVTLVGSWVVAFFIGMTYLPRLFGAPADFPLMALVNDPIFVVSFLVYFVLGYLLYAAILVGIGSVCNTLKEAQNLMQPVMLLLITPLVLMMPISRDPNGTIAVVLSYIPFFTPFVMMNRAAGPPALWEYAATTVLLLLAIFAALWAAAKVFRIGILLTGKPPGVREILRWVRAPVGIVPDRS